MKPGRKHVAPQRGIELRVAWLIAVWILRCGELQAETVWKSPNDVLKWVADAPAGAAERLSEGGRRFVRLRAPLRPQLQSPGCADVWLPDACPRLFDPGVYNAVRVVLRHNMAWTRLGGYWLHPNSDMSHGSHVPAFDGVNAPGDGAWHDIVLSLEDSPFLDRSQGVHLLVLGPDVPPMRQFVEMPAPLASQEYVDVERIELLRVPLLSAGTTVTSLRPSKAEQGRVVTIEGTGFAEPAARNAVLFGDGQFWLDADILGGDATSLSVRVPMWQGEKSVSLTVRTPGGHEARAPTPFIVFSNSHAYNGTPRDPNQRATIGSSVDLSIRLDQSGYGPVGQPVGFRVVWGEARLSTPDASTDDDGVATTRLEPKAVGPVIVRAEGNFLVKGKVLDNENYFVVTALPNGDLAPLPEAVFGDELHSLMQSFIYGTCQPALSDVSPAVRSAAAAAFGHWSIDGGVSFLRVEVLRGLLEDPDARVRVSAALALDGHGGDLTEASLRALAERDPDPVVRRAASVAALLVPSELVPPPPGVAVIEALSDADRRLRASAARALGRLAYRGLDARAPLLKATSDPSPAVRRAVLEALGNSKPAIPATALALFAARDDTVANVRASALKAITALAYSRAAASAPTGSSLWENTEPPALVRALDDANANVRVVAANALGEQGARPKLALADSTTVRLIDSLGDNEARVRAAAASALSRIGVPAVPHLEHVLLTADRQLAERAAEVLASTGSLGVSTLVRALTHEKAEVRTRAAVGLGRGGPKAAAAVPRLFTALDDREPRVRQEAAYALDRIGAPANAAAIELMRNVPRPELSPGRPSPKRSDDPPLELLLHAAAHAGGRTQLAAAYLLRSDLRRYELQQVLETGDTRARRVAYIALRSALRLDPSFASEWLPSRLVQTAARDPDPEIRRSVALALVVYGLIPWRDEPLFRLLDDSDPANRDFAARYFAKQPAPPAEALSTLIVTLTRGSIRLQLEAARALGRIGPSARASLPALTRACESAQQASERAFICEALKTVRGH